MQEIVFISIIFLIIAQVIGLLVYYSKRNKYSKSAQNTAIFLPPCLFTLLTIISVVLYLFIKWKAGEINLVLGSNWDRELFLIGAYTLGGFILNIFLSISIQMGILLFSPPQYKSSRNRHRSKNSKSELSK